MEQKRRRWTCPLCNQTFAIPATSVDPEICLKCRELQSIRDLSLQLPVLKSHFAQRQSAKLTEVIPSFGNLIVGILDWRFDRYLTPMIIRTIWILLIYTLMLGLAYQLADLVFGLITDEDLDMAMQNWFESSSPAKEKTSGFVFKNSHRLWVVGRAVGCLVGSVVVLLVVRVYCEFAIVIFNISSSLKRIELLNEEDAKTE